MARPLRIYVPGAWYHVTARGNERRDIFRDDQDRERFVARLAEMTERYAVRLYAYVLMSNHYHLLVEPKEDNLSRAMQWLGVGYSQEFNRRHSRAGHLFQGRFRAIVVDGEQWGVELSRYVHLNPIRIGRRRLGKRGRARHRHGAGRAVAASVVGGRMEALRSYCWSSYRAYVGLDGEPEWLETEAMLERMEGPKKGRRKAYQRYVEEGLLEGAMESPWDRVAGQVLLGGEEFVERAQEWLKGDEREQAGLRGLRLRPSWEEAVRVVEELKGEPWEQFRDRRGDWGRDVTLWLGRTVCGLKLGELSERVGLGHYGSASTALRYLQARSANNPRLSKLMSQAKIRLSTNE